MFLFAARVAKNPCIAAPLVRGMSTAGRAGSFGKEPTRQQPAEGSSSAAFMRKQLADRVDDMIAQPNQTKPPVTDESALYLKKFNPKHIYHPAEFHDDKTPRAFPKVLDERPAPKDPFVSLGIDPLKHYKNTVMLSQFVTELGKIKPRKKSMLSAKSQNRVAKAIKRARAFGLIPLVSKPGAAYNYTFVGPGSYKHS
ncbi:hypothetical protein LPJ81_002730 [Coemansia sp. IMI 209127]|nr:hypothetical protein LPJ81_002730 [Coemansia sp. IMI 209127]